MIPIKVDIEKAERYYEEFIENIWSSKTDGKIFKNYFRELSEKRCMKNTEIGRMLRDEEGLKELILLKPDEVRDLAQTFNDIFYENGAFKKECETVFDELKDLFTKAYNKLDKYAFVNFTDVRVCPYCNRAFVYEPMTEEHESNTIRKIKGQIDHFFPKSKYPILALSYFNLIPSCGVCNYVKSEKDPLEVSELKSPYEIKADEFEFTINIENTNVFSYSLNKIAKGFKVKLKAPKGNNTLFALEDIYNNHKDIAAEVLFKAKYYNEAYIESIRKTLEGIKLTDFDIYRLVFWAYKDTPGNRPLSKFISDIAKQIIRDF